MGDVVVVVVVVVEVPGEGLIGVVELVVATVVVGDVVTMEVLMVEVEMVALAQHEPNAWLQRPGPQ